MAGRQDRRRGWCAMILDKRSMKDDRRPTTDDRRPAAKSLRRAGKQTGLGRRFVAQFAICNLQFAIPPRWVRLLLLTVAVGTLALIGATLGRGFGAGDAVVSQALGPTVAAVATAVPQPANTAAQVPTAVPLPVVAAAPAAPSVGVPPAAPVPLDMAQVAERWPLLAEERFDGVSERWPEVRSSPSWSSNYQDGGYQMQVDSRPGI